MSSPSTDAGGAAGQKLEPIDRLMRDHAPAGNPDLSALERDAQAMHVPSRPLPAAPPDASADEARRAALRRVEQSREALREVLMPASERAAQRRRLVERLAAERRAAMGDAAQASFSASAAAEPHPMDTATGRLKGLLRRLSRGLREGQFATVAGTAVGFFRGWWRAQPWHTTGEVVALAVKTELTPLARRHPWATLGGAALAGAALVTLKPWRWSPVVATTRPLVGVATRWSVAQLTSPAVQLAAAAILSTWVRQRMALHETQALREEALRAEAALQAQEQAARRVAAEAAEAADAAAEASAAMRAVDRTGEVLHDRS